MSRYEDYYLGNLIGITEGYDPYLKNFILLPPNDKYTSGYGFYVSNNLVSQVNTHVSLCDDFNIVLIMGNDFREKGKRYTRYKIEIREIKDILKNYESELVEKDKLDKINHIDKLNKKVGRIVYGHYRGNEYLLGDGTYYKSMDDYFFQYKNTFYNFDYTQVRNVRIKYVVVDNIGKGTYEEIYKSLIKELNPHRIIMNTIEQLKEIIRNEQRTDLDSMIINMEKDSQELLTKFKKIHNIQ